ncbi:MAG: hypothetical protein MJ247_02360 [Alphaproteobacteria bacterium]|nr:hypothetical protein [Alphaproteobacteria bacterium]
MNVFNFFHSEKLLNKIVISSICVYFFASVISYLGGFIDGIIVCKLIDPISFSTISITSPFMQASKIFMNILVVGTQILCSTSIGKKELEKTKKIVFLSVVLAFVISIILAILTIIFISPITHFLLIGKTENSEVVSNIKSYLIGTVWSFFPIFIMTTFPSIVQIDGDKKRCFLAPILFSIFNIASDLISVFIFKGGMLGIGLATSISYYIAAGYLFLHFFSKEHYLNFKFFKIDLIEIFQLIKAGLTEGLNKFFIFISEFMINAIFLLLSDKYLLPVLGIYVCLMNLFNCFPKTFGKITLTLSSIKIGENDKFDLKKILIILLKHSGLITICLGGVLFISTPLVVRMFLDSNSECFNQACVVVRFLALNLFAQNLSMIILSYYQAIKSHRIVIFMNLIQRIFAPLTISLIFADLMGYKTIFFADFLSKYAVLLFVVLYAIIYNKGKFSVENMIMLPKNFGIEAKDYVSFYVTSFDDAMRNSKDIKAFCYEHQCNIKKTFFIQIVFEEITKNIFYHGKLKNKNNFVNIRLFKKDEDIYLIIQDDSSIFDIAKWYYQNNSKELDKNLGSKLIMNLTKKVSYFNLYGINSTQLIF